MKGGRENITPSSLVVLGTGTGTAALCTGTCTGTCWYSTCNLSVEAAAPPAKKPKLLASYTARQPAQSATGSSLQQLNKYLEM